MMILRCIGALFATALVIAPAAGLADELPEIRQNPFARPSSVVIADEEPRSFAETGTRTSLDLRATMVSDQGSLANVAGKVVSPGETVQGFTLLRVHEDRAIFDYQGERVTIYVRPQSDENNE
ncbi:MAG: hypothetical protein WBM68_01150 [Woeseia sp.]